MAATTDILVGYIPAGPREALRTTGAWADSVRAHIGDPVVARANASPTVSYGATVLDMLLRGLGKIDDRGKVFAFQYALYTIVVRILLLKAASPNVRIIGYSGGIQPALMACGILDPDELPNCVSLLNQQTFEKASANRLAGISACTVDFTDAGWTEGDILSTIYRKYPGKIHVQDRRAAAVIDFAGHRDSMTDFLATLDRKAGMAVRASFLRSDGGYHTPLMRYCDLAAEDETVRWVRARERFAKSSAQVGSSVGHWWPQNSSPLELRDLFLTTHTTPMESGRMAALVDGDSISCVCSRIVLQEMLAGTGLRVGDQRIVDASWL